MLGAPDSGVPIMRTRADRWRSIVFPVLVLVIIGAIALLLTGRGQQTAIQGAGSTLAQPLIERSIIAFRNAQAADDPTRPEQTGNDWVLNGSGIEYEPVGSLGGIMRLSDPEVAFAVSDYPLSADGLKEHGVAQFPIALGAIGIAYNLDSAEELRLDAASLAAIYLGEITRWNDPKIAALNPGVKLPDTDITPVHRSDGSGSTRGFTGFLAAGTPQWTLGTRTEIDWPTGEGAERTEGVLNTVRDTPGAIGYVEYGQAQRVGLALAALANGAGSYVTPNADTIAAAAASHDWSGADDYVNSLATADDRRAYPATVAIYAMVKRDPTFEQQTERVLGYLKFLVEDFGDGAEDLGYVPLPTSAGQDVENYWNTAISGTA